VAVLGPRGGFSRAPLRAAGCIGRFGCAACRVASCSTRRRGVVGMFGLGPMELLVLGALVALPVVGLVAGYAVYRATMRRGPGESSPNLRKE
jgi:hypothetical protein